MMRIYGCACGRIHVETDHLRLSFTREQYVTLIRSRAGLLVELEGQEDVELSSRMWASQLESSRSC